MDSRSNSNIPTNLEDSGVIDRQSRLASSRSKSALASLNLEGSVVLGFQNLASSGRGPLPDS
jgi:hypothetical protein